MTGASKSKDTSRIVLDRILSREEKETGIKDIHKDLEDLAKRILSGELPIENCVITKELSEHPTDHSMPSCSLT